MKSDAAVGRQIGTAKMVIVWEGDELVFIPVPQKVVVERAFQAIWNQYVLEIFQVAKPGILLASHSTRSGFLVIMR
jgi:hypothetical protein